MVMGHSLGEYGALVAAGAISFDAALRAVSARGNEMTRCALDDNGMMAAVFGPIDDISRVLETVDGYVVVANINSTKEAVIGGGTKAVTEAMEKIREVIPSDPKKFYDMKKVEDNLHVGDFLLDRFDIGVPHIHDDGFQSFPLLSSHLVEKTAEGPGFAVLADPDDSSAQIIQDHGQIAVSLADGDLVDGQNSEAFEVGLAVLSFQKELVDVLDLCGLANRNIYQDVIGRHRHLLRKYGSEQLAFWIKRPTLPGL
jgi:hypothetical protein